MATWAFLPDVSSTTGPCGTAGSGGAGPRSAGIARSHSVRESAENRSASAATSFSRTPGTGAAWPVFVSPSQSSIRSSASRVNANAEPSGEKTGIPRRDPAGTATRALRPSGSDRTDRPEA